MFSKEFTRILSLVATYWHLRIKACLVRCLALTKCAFHIAKHYSFYHITTRSRSLTIVKSVTGDRYFHKTYHNLACTSPFLHISLSNFILNLKVAGSVCSLFHIFLYKIINLYESPPLRNHLRFISTYPLYDINSHIDRGVIFLCRIRFVIANRETCKSKEKTLSKCLETKLFKV